MDSLFQIALVVMIAHYCTAINYLNLNSKDIPVTMTIWQKNQSRGRRQRGMDVSTQTRNLPLPEMGRPFPVMVPLPEVGNPISGTAFTICYFCFLARAPLQSRAERERRHALPKI